MPRALPLLCCAFAATGARLQAQSLNVDVGVHPTFAVPSASFGGAAASAGTWNALPVVAGTPQALVDLAGGATGVTLTFSGGVATAASSNLTGAGPDDLALLGDVLDPGSVARTVTIAGLAPGDYALTSYSIAPDDAAFRTAIDVAGSLEGVQVVGGAWPGAYVQGVTHALHHVTLLAPQDVVITVQRTAPPPMGFNFGSLNGLQIVREDSAGASFCAGDDVDPAVTSDCPCLNFGASGRGCANSSNAAGALLSGSGSAAFDTIVLAGSGMPATSACIYLQGDALDDAAFGDGVRCAGGTLLRLRAKTNASGASAFPDTTDTETLAQRGGVAPGSGAVRWYQAYYRNASSGFCPTATFNVTSGWRVIW
ncbi:MAG: hypothetical protein IPJ77_12070 [Planctomycetes bacterium]|nr:hypothetical protein [Planctomycetota bacterium]